MKIIFTDGREIKVWWGFFLFFRMFFHYLNAEDLNENTNGYEKINKFLKIFQLRISACRFIEHLK